MFVGEYLWEERLPDKPKDAKEALRDDPDNDWKVGDKLPDTYICEMDWTVDSFYVRQSKRWDGTITN